MHAQYGSTAAISIHRTWHCIMIEATYPHILSFANTIDTSIKTAKKLVNALRGLFKL